MKGGLVSRRESIWRGRGGRGRGGSEDVLDQKTFENVDFLKK